ncbi:MmcQ/YjbR family DNA-binding protein [Alginatibacterium sediminis]|uniref:MmcQ/YjbR family DNA-binding protein n=1 Tax=Alginatibacterium sediminis TaxID=2164068 RepID=A0A420EL71_9ALTE|nr:MmcQ/YjbR family DNA-binding protein [Alginatibacterium sediminis]RKF21423.1 MmcQ/YjbR family DNA-binding protein [Alginatibacterium sediminis]
MNREQFNDYLLSKPGASVDYPFDTVTPVYKVAGKMFALMGEYQGVARVNLKCEPEEALALRDIFEAVTPGYHMNKRHWNSVLLNDSVPEGELQRMADNSYNLVLDSLPKYKQQQLLGSLQDSSQQ